ncbi:hypothetical protein [Acinetobacter ursingii]|uniref:hypothetical protein n=3 Tax=Acinetobacter ursingii TaxID=108980 RepID=UPI003AF438E3
MQTDDLKNELDILFDKIDEYQIDPIKIMNNCIESDINIRKTISYISKFINENYSSLLKELDINSKDKLVLELEKLNFIIDNKMDFSLIISNAKNNFSNSFNSNESSELKKFFCDFNDFILHNDINSLKNSFNALSSIYGIQPLSDNNIDYILSGLSKAILDNVVLEDVNDLRSLLKNLTASFPYIVADAASELSINQFELTGYANKRIEKIVNINNTLKASKGGSKRALNQKINEKPLKDKAIKIFTSLHPELNRKWRSRNEFVSYFLHIENAKREFNELLTDATVKRWIKEFLNE